MYETPSRSNSRLNSRRPPALNVPSFGAPVPPGSTPSGSNGSSGSGNSGGYGYPGTPGHNGMPMSPGSPSFAPQTPQQRLLLRKPMSMQTLSTVRSSSRLSSTPRGLGAGVGGFGIGGASEVYKGKIHVGVRAKPSDGGPGAHTVGGPWLIAPDNNVIDHDTAGNFQFDRVYDGSSTNTEVFDQSVDSLIQKVVNGFNATVFAYGTTGSGKTFTMQGSEMDPGVIQRSAHRLFDLLESKGKQASVRLSYFEIYNERVYDLLSNDNKPTEVMLRDGSVGDTRVVGQREVDARNADELLNWVATGDLLRRTSSTQYNEHSSRSHAVVRVQVTDGNAQSILYLCDLAGSERAVVHTERRKEGSYINKSLLTLSTVISILSQGGGGHVPYRDSKLTRLLQPSLSGTALVSMLCTIQTGPPPAGGAETVNSVRFAAKAKNITVMAKRNSVFDDGMGSGNMVNNRMMEHLQFENDSLKRESQRLQAERDDLQEKLAILETGDGNPEASLEAMSGISFAEDDGEEGGDALSRLRKEVSWYKEENGKLHHRVSHLVSEITALDANLANLESMSSSESSGSSTPSTLAHAGGSDDTLRAEIDELKEQLRDKDMLIECLTGINSTRSKLLGSPTGLSASENATTEAIQDLRI